ncbi:MAG: DUF1289 domain-containing protein [Porticoccaceae bacterium]|jgi:uncharacterized protein|nr:DUF1289 domain-containing protein [Porticoccaceae bacterium]MDG1310877.1 DUF1289 domain-containing protein [Porticoccaceae bacterium]
MSEKPVASPCTSICMLNEEGLCAGCYRTSEEIREWSSLDNHQRLDVLILCGERSQKNNPFY